MSRSITAKLVLAFLAVSIVVVALASGITYWLTVREFKNLVYNQAHDRFVADATLYYQTNGSWYGALAYFNLRDSFPVPIGGGPGPQTQQTFNENGGIITVNNGDGGGAVTGVTTVGTPPGSFAFLLADADGRVLVPAGAYKVGDTIPASKLNGGTAITVNGKRVGTVLSFGAMPSLGPRETQYLSRTNQSLLYAGIGAAFLALILGFILARTLSKPLRAMTTAIHAMAKGDLRQHVTVRSHDEIGELAAAFNQMSADLDRSNQVRRQMTADIAHDLRTPLTVIGGYVESMQEGVLKPTSERLETIHSEVLHLQRLVDDLRTLSQADAGELTLNRELVAPSVLLARMSGSYNHLASMKDIHLETIIEPNLPTLSLDLDRMAQVFGNLIANSLRYTPEGGKIILSARLEDDCIVFAVRDNGSGISPEALPHIFDRFYRADPARGLEDGSGLGLAIARSITDAHGGKISAQSNPSAGTTITLTFPLN